MSNIHEANPTLSEMFKKMSEDNMTLKEKLNNGTLKNHQVKLAILESRKGLGQISHESRIGCYCLLQYCFEGGYLTPDGLRRLVESLEE